VDKNLTSQDIDRIFIATNFEAEDIEENDDKGLCRYEWVEIMARMAKAKFTDKKVVDTVYEACELLLGGYVVPNSIEKMGWQSFRDEQLWTLDVDDMLKANLQGVDALYRMFATTQQKTKRTKFFSLLDAMGLREAALRQKLTGVNLKVLEKKER